ncbi:hypothetical protein BHE74_00000469 [Ensete ventricosum]|nr:hypothetical protein GW17_00029064 [Ensete ventricosum]RWW90420.1 hypothetical protein BHE74_00000469 [Ensete ventricosum]
MVFDWGSCPRVTGRMVVSRGVIESPVNPMRVELIGDRSTVISLSFLKALRYKTSTELPVLTMTLFTCALVMLTENTNASSWSGYIASPVSKAISGSLSPNDDIYLLLNSPLAAGGRLLRPLGVAPEIPLTYKLFDLIMVVVTFLDVVVIVSVESVILRLVPKLSGTLHGVGHSHESLLFGLEKDLHPG